MVSNRNPLTLYTLTNSPVCPSDPSLKHGFDRKFYAGNLAIEQLLRSSLSPPHNLISLTCIRRCREVDIMVGPPVAYDVPVRT